MMIALRFVLVILLPLMIFTALLISMAIIWETVVLLVPNRGPTGMILLATTCAAIAGVSVWSCARTAAGQPIASRKVDVKAGKAPFLGIGAAGMLGGLYGAGTNLLFGLIMADGVEDGGTTTKYHLPLMSGIVGIMIGAIALIRHRRSEQTLPVEKE